MGTMTWLGGVLGVSFMALAVRTRAKRRRGSIRGMLRDSRPYAVRPRS
jgi:hypothetical protein